jgi:putative hemolysin
MIWPNFHHYFVALLANSLPNSFCGHSALVALTASTTAYTTYEVPQLPVPYSTPSGATILLAIPNGSTTFPRGAFITISNHPYGVLDGIITVDMLGSRRSDLKVMVNQILSRIEPLADNFVAVTPTGTAKRSATAATLSGIRTSLAHLHEGHPMSFFPSGAVSDLHPWRGEISDREWQEGLIRLIQRAKVPVIPIHFEGRNSLFYYLLGLVDWRVGLLRLPREIFNKRKGHHRVVIGEVITPDQIAACATIGELTAKLRKAVYDMPNPTHFTPASKLHAKE